MKINCIYCKSDFISNIENLDFKKSIVRCGHCEKEWFYQSELTGLEKRINDLDQELEENEKRLDSEKKNNIENIDILKIDTQGYEDKVLQGAQNLIKENRIKLIQVEIIFSEIYEDPLQIYDIEKILIPNDYKLFAISNGGSLISKYSYESDFIYIAADTYKDFKANSPYLNN